MSEEEDENRVVQIVPAPAGWRIGVASFDDEIGELFSEWPVACFGLTAVGRILPVYDLGEGYLSASDDDGGPSEYRFVFHDSYSDEIKSNMRADAMQYCRRRHRIEGKSRE